MAYGQAIIKLLQKLLSPARLPGPVGILEDKNQMRRRMNMIATFKKTDRWPAPAVIAFAGLALTALTDAQARQNASGEPRSADPATARAAVTPPSATSTVGATHTDKPKIRLEKVKSFAGTNDIIEKSLGMFLSPNGNFLSYEGKIIPVLGANPFVLSELHGTTDLWWSPDGTKIAFYGKGPFCPYG